MIQNRHQSSRSVVVPAIGCVCVWRAGGCAFQFVGSPRPHLDQTLGLIVTAVLLVSSFFMNRAETSMEHGDRKGFLRGISITLILGIGFLLGVVGVEWPQAIHEGITPSSGAEGAIFFMMTGMHAFPRVDRCHFPGCRLRNGARACIRRKALGRGSGCRLLALLWTWSGFSSTRPCI
jgi:hypothetical protein